MLQAFCENPARIARVTKSDRKARSIVVAPMLAYGYRAPRDPERLVDLVERYGDRIRPVALDVTDEVAARQALDLALNAFGRLDVLVNNAGYGHTTPFEQVFFVSFPAVMLWCLNDVGRNVFIIGWRNRHQGREWYR